MPDSDPTTLDPSSSAPSEPASRPEAPKPAPTTAAGSSPAIRYADRIFMAGTTGSGKSTLARRMVLSARPPRLVISPSDDEITALPGAETFHDPARPPDAATARFVPRDPDDRDAYDTVYRWAFARFPRLVWCDEAGLVAPAQGYPRAANTYVVQGRKRQLGHLACHTRPREVARNFIAQAQHVIVFALPLPEDRAHIAALAGIEGGLLERAMADLPEHGFVWWDQRARRLRVCPPLAT